MAFYPQNATGLNYITYPAGPTASGTTITANASNNTKGSYTQMVASSTFQSNSLQFMSTSNDNTAGLLFLTDIATGGAGSETVIIPNIASEATSSTSVATCHAHQLFRIKIASSTRIAIRCQCSTGSSTEVVAITLSAAGGVDGCTAFVDYGTSTGDSGATQIDPGGSANTKGSYVELTSSTSAIIQDLLTSLTYGHTTVATCSWCVDVATGAAASEVVLIPDIRHSSSTTSGGSGSVQPRSYNFLTYIAASTRIAARASCSITTATARLFDFAIYGAVAPTESSGSGGGSFASFG